VHLRGLLLEEGRERKGRANDGRGETGTEEKGIGGPPALLIALPDAR